MADSAIANGTPAQPSFDADTMFKYECDVCGDMFAYEKGVFTCKDHFYCKKCTIEVVHRSLRNINEFPASCCALSRDGIFPFQFESLLDEETVDMYLLKLEEFRTPKVKRVYCADYTCAAFLPRDQFNLTEDCVEVGVCMCGTITCIDCKTEWQLDHTCPRYENPFVKPDWLPEYSPDCRVKQCPSCHEWIELSEACNHMTCVLCDNQFCFICLLPWVRQHETEGCPIYGDPTVGYDEHGYERTPGGLHLYSGRDWLGYDRRGVDEFGGYADGAIAPPELETIAPDDVVDLDYGWEAAEPRQAYHGNPISGHRQNELDGGIGDFGEVHMSLEDFVEAHRP